MSFEVYWSCAKCFESSRQEGRRTRIRGGPEEEKQSHVRRQLKSGREELGCWAVVCLELFGCLTKEKKILTPVSYTFILVVWLFSF